MKTIRTILTGAAICLSCLSCFGQAGGVYQLIGGNGTGPLGWTSPYGGSGFTLWTGTTNQLSSTTATNNIGSTTSVGITSSNLVRDVHNYDNVGLTYSDTAGASAQTNGLHGLMVFRSFDAGATFDQTPFWTFQSTNAASGAAFLVQTNLDCRGVTTLGFTLFDAVTNGYQTNVLLELNLKRPAFDFHAAIN
jgi:hypothetical protein